MESSKSRIITQVELITETAIQTKDFTSLKSDATLLGLDLFLERSNVSRILNDLHKTGHFIKLVGRPTLFLSRKILERYYPNVFIPSSIPKEASITDYLVQEDKIDVQKNSPSFGSYVVSENSKLYHALRRAKESLLYPNSHLHTLLIGESSVGKDEFCETMFEYAKSNDIISKGKSMEVVECKGTKDAEVFLGSLFGSIDKDKKGIFETAKNSMVVLRNIDALNQATLQRIRDALVNQYFLPMSETRLSNHIKLTNLIVGTAESYDESNDNVFKQMFPTHINIPALKERTIEEMLVLTLRSLQREADRINQTIRISKGVTSCFVMAYYSGNLAHLISEIQLACASAYSRSLNTSAFFIDIDFEDISNEVLESISDINERIDDLNDFFALFEDEHLFFSPIQTNKELQLLYDINETLTFAEFESINRLDNQLVDVCLEDINYVTSIQLNTIRAVLLKDIYNELYPLLKSSSLIENENLLYGLLLHISTVIKKIEKGGYSIKESDNEFKIANQNDYDLAQAIQEAVESIYDIALPSYEVDYIATYHYLSSQWVENKYIQLLVVSDDSDIAKNYSSYLNSLNHKPKVFHLEVDSKMNRKDIVSILRNEIETIDKGKGVIIATDSEMVIHTFEQLKNMTDTEFAHTTNISIQYLVSLLQKLDSLDVSLAAIRKEEVVDDRGSKENRDDYIHAREMLDEISSKILSESLIFLNPEKSTHVLFQVLTRIIETLEIPYSDELLVKFIFHCCFLIERCIRKEPIQDPEARNIIANNPDIFYAVEKHFSIVNETFSIYVPNTEYGMVINIFKQHQ